MGIDMTAKRQGSVKDAGIFFNPTLPRYDASFPLGPSWEI